MYTMRPALPAQTQGLMNLKVKRLHFQIWLSGDDVTRYEEVRAKAKERQPYSKDSDLHRRLLGLEKEQKLLTDAEVLYFRGQAERPKTITATILTAPKKSAKKRGTNDTP